MNDTSQKIKPLLDGSYTVKTTQNSCASLISIPYYFLVTAVNNINFNQQVNIYPNPFSETLIIDYKINNIPEILYEIYSLNGKKIEERKAHSGSLINLSKYTNGTYLIRILDYRTKQLIFSSKIVKLK